MNSDELIEQRSVIIPRVWPRDRYELRPYFTTENVREQAETIGLGPIDLLVVRAMLLDYAEHKEYVKKQAREKPHQSCLGCGYTAYHSASCTFPGFRDVKVGME